VRTEIVVTTNGTFKFGVKNLTGIVLCPLLRMRSRQFAKNAPNRGTIFKISRHRPIGNRARRI